MKYIKPQLKVIEIETENEVEMLVVDSKGSRIEWPTYAPKEDPNFEYYYNVFEDSLNTDYSMKFGKSILDEKW